MSAFDLKNIITIRNERLGIGRSVWIGNKTADYQITRFGILRKENPSILRIVHEDGGIVQMLPMAAQKQLSNVFGCHYNTDFSYMSSDVVRDFSVEDYILLSNYALRNGIRINRKKGIIELKNAENK